jgi:hypothetical protein
MSVITEEKGEMSVDVVSLHPFLSSQSRISRRTLSLKKWEGRDDRGWTPLHIAAKKGDLEEVRLFIFLHNQYCVKKTILLCFFLFLLVSIHLIYLQLFILCM